MKFLLQANSVLPDNNVKYLIQSEVNLAKLKTKVFPNLENYLIHYENLLNRFAIDSKEEEEITYELLLSCYDATIDVDCENTRQNTILLAMQQKIESSLQITIKIYE